MLEKSAIYYPAWQMQCCGKPFRVGSKILWTCYRTKSVRNGTAIFFYEEHHLGQTHCVNGTVTRITAEMCESPKAEGKLTRDKMIYNELSDANGWESERPDDESTRRSFMGYIVELKDVTFHEL